MLTGIFLLQTVQR